MAVEYNECVKKRKIVEFANGRDIAPKEIETAEKDLATAKKSASMFHTARALLYNAGYREHSHASAEEFLIYAGDKVLKPPSRRQNNEQ